MGDIRVGIVGVGNCASAPIQEIDYYARRCGSDAIGLMHFNIGG